MHNSKYHGRTHFFAISNGKNEIDFYHSNLSSKKEKFQALRSKLKASFIVYENLCVEPGGNPIKDILSYKSQN
jgi:hypothetical protein